ncbi:hypothetical protein [Pseudomonas lundensis]|uniref:hypothetical protein n=1 Tax=Pseudomonas lundensis TaxID=86185 RepID=UPI00089DB807|nr:hypothetical protein [Pseudomonas lundensis]
MSDYSKLKELAEATKGWDNLKSCWPEETEDGDLEVNWFVGAVTEDDDKYPVLEVNTAQYDALEDAGRLARYYAAANPSAVLALIAENEALKGPHDWLAEDLIKELVDNAQAIQENADDGEDDPFVIVLLASASRIRRQEANIDKLRAENERLKAENAGLKTGYEAYEQVNAELKAEVEGLRATADLQKLLPEVSDALEELELHGLHSDQGYRKLKDWYRKVGLAYRVIQGPMFGAEHGELVSQNTWLRSVVEHYAQQHAPLEPIPDMEGWSARLPGYDLPSLLRDAERYRRVRDIACRVRAYVGFHLVVQLPSPSGSSFCAAKAFDEAIDAALGQGEQS